MFPYSLYRNNQDTLNLSGDPGIDDIDLRTSLALDREVYTIRRAGRNVYIGSLVDYPSS
jgi:hypothetical protein